MRRVRINVLFMIIDLIVGVCSFQLRLNAALNVNIVSAKYNTDTRC